MKKYKILIVDDSVANLATMISIIEKHKPESIIYQANGAKAALDVIDNVVPDIILLDWEMPKVNGIELMTKIHELPATQNTPCIIVTGIRITAQNLKTALEAGAMDFVRKPIDVLEFLARINSAITIAENHKALIAEKESKIIENIAFASEVNHFLKSALYKSRKIATHIKSSKLSNSTDLIDVLSEELKNKLKTEGWKKHSQAYQNLYPVFSKSLITAHPSLTSNEIELCQMTRLGLKNKEISQLMFLTLGSLNVNKSRLRKKLNLSSYQNIQSYLVGL